MPEAIVVEGLRKEYGTVKAVDGVDFSVPTGEVFAFLGPNGAGKTTTTEILEGLRRRTSGTVQVLGFDPWVDGGRLHPRIGVIPQEFKFFEKTQPREAIQYYASLFGVRADADEILRRVILEDKARARFDTLSGGQKQKLGLALALVNDPELCFLDEPTTGLDPQARRAIWEVIRQLKRDGRTVFLTTHYLEEAALLSDQVAIIHQGRIIAAGTSEEIIQKHGRPDRLRIEGGSEVVAFLRDRLGLAPVVENRHMDVEVPSKEAALGVLGALERSGLPWDRFDIVRDTLDDVFVRLVGRMDEGVLRSEASP